MKTKYSFNIGFLSVLMILALWISARSYFPALICSVTIHELGHIVMAKLCNIPLYKFKLNLFGASLYPENMMYSYKKEILLCFGGPLFNLLSVFLCAPFNSPRLNTFILSSVALATLNMLPISSFDGGRIFSAILNTKISPVLTSRILNITSFIMLFSVWCFSVYLLIKAEASLSMFIFSISVFSKIFISQKL